MTTFGPARHHIEAAFFDWALDVVLRGDILVPVEWGSPKRKQNETCVLADSWLWLCACKCLCLLWTGSDVLEWVMNTWKGSVSWNQSPAVVSSFTFRGIITCWVLVLARFSSSLPSSFLKSDKLMEPRRAKRQFCIECISLLRSIALILWFPSLSSCSAPSVPFGTLISAGMAEVGSESTQTSLLQLLQFIGGLLIIQLFRYKYCCLECPFMMQVITTRKLKTQKYANLNVLPYFFPPLTIKVRFLKNATCNIFLHLIIWVNNFF